MQKKFVFKKPNNLPGAIRDNEEYLVVDTIKRQVIQSDSSKAIALRSAKLMQEHNNKYGHVSDYQVLHKDDCILV